MLNNSTLVDLYMNRKLRSLNRQARSDRVQDKTRARIRLVIALLSQLTLFT